MSKFYGGPHRPGLFMEPLTTEEDVLAKELMLRGMTFYEANQFLRVVVDYVERKLLPTLRSEL